MRLIDRLVKQPGSLIDNITLQVEFLKLKVQIDLVSSTLIIINLS